MKQYWKSDACYEKDHGVNGSICSFIVYLSEVSKQLSLTNFAINYNEFINSISAFCSLESIS